MKLKRPDSVFLIRVCPVYRVFSCDAKLTEEKRGLIGFHNFQTCPNCKIVPEGWEMWGGNGHMQASAATFAHLLHWIKIKAREQWKTQAGGMMGYRFARGSALHYRTN